MLNGTASQSSVSHGGIASRAVDGNTAQSYSGNSCTRTSNEMNSWWQLDLGKPQLVSKVMVREIKGMIECSFELVVIIDVIMVMMDIIGDHRWRVIL